MSEGSKPVKTLWSQAKFTGVHIGHEDIGGQEGFQTMNSMKVRNSPAESNPTGRMTPALPPPATRVLLARGVLPPCVRNCRLGSGRTSAG